MKKTISILLSLLMLMSCFAVPSFAADESILPLREKITDTDKGIIMQPGTDGTQKNFSWYAPAEAQEACVDVSLSPDMTDAVCFKGKTIDTYQGDKSAKVTVSGLETGTTYYYTCNAGDVSSDVYSFTTSSADSFSAMYVTDIHVSEDENDPEELVRTSKRFEDVITQAKTKSDISYILSAGDQASSGLRSEYVGLTSSNAVKSLAFATTLGNHDRKGVDYKYFNNIPNERVGLVNDYQSGDYWFVQNNALFIFINSNNGSGTDHRAVIKEAVEKNPDAKWRVAVMHHDLYSGAIDSRESETRFMRILFSPIFDEFNIDLVLLGHNHYYSVSKVLYNGKIEQEFNNGDTIENVKGTVYMVSNSLTRPKGEMPTYNDNVAFGLETKEDTERVLYNIINFTADEINVTTYDFDENDVFASFSIKKTDDYKAPKISFFRKFAGFITSFLGTVFALFNNISVYNRLNEKGYDINFFENLRNTHLVK